MKNIDEMTPDEINAELNAYYELYYLAGLIEPDDLKEEPAIPNSKNFIDVQPIKKNRKLTEEEQTDIINKLQSKTGTQWKHAFLGYFANENGQIYSLCLNRLLKLQKRKNSKKPDDFYFYFFASYHGNEKRVFVHQLINALFNDLLSCEILIHLIISVPLIVYYARIYVAFRGVVLGVFYYIFWDLSILFILFSIV